MKDYVEIFEKYENGKLYERRINGVPVSISDFERDFVAWSSVDTLQRFVAQRRFITVEQAQRICPHRFVSPICSPPVNWEQCLWCMLVQHVGSPRNIHGNGKLPEKI